MIAVFSSMFNVDYPDWYRGIVNVLKAVQIDTSFLAAQSACAFYPSTSNFYTELLVATLAPMLLFIVAALYATLI